MTIIDFLEMYHLSFSKTSNVGAEYISIQCPFCSDNSFHGCIHTKKIFYNCWKCGWHPMEKVIQEITELPTKEIKKIIRELTGVPIIRKRKEIKEKPTTLRLEGEELTDKHRNYLLSRNYDPDFIIEKYKIKGTNHLGDYKFRIIAPIFFEKQLVSYQGRDITDQSKSRYKACPKEKEIIHHKHILYNIDNAISDTLIIVEGIMDVWRLGDGSVATFGTGYSQEQIDLIVKKGYKKVFIIYDPGAQDKANILGKNLNLFGIQATIIDLLDCDPGELSENEAKNLLKEIYYEL